MQKPRKIVKSIKLTISYKAGVIICPTLSIDVGLRRSALPRAQSWKLE
tara:strand:+ start:37 stop:180 length:144 start_codon:yes stop_codon:yes gene_type:complete